MTATPEFPSSCDEKDKLVIAYQYTVREYFTAVQELNERIGKSSKAEYETIYRLAESARTRSMAAKEALDRHTTAHDC